MKNNKGYTLTELLVSIAIFAIAMVGIISIMSNSIKAYSMANLDVSIQENAQLVANQVEELLCDADHNISGTGPYSFRKGLELYALKLDGNKLYLHVASESTDYLLADNVSSFEINSYNASTNYGMVAGYSNTVKAFNEASFTIKFDDGHGSTYDVTRNIFFRNEVEDSTFHGIEYTSANASSSISGGSDNVKDINVKRYQKYNLTTENEIKYGCKLCKEVSSSVAGCFTIDGRYFVEDTDASLFFTLTTGTFPSASLSEYAGATTYYIQTTSGVNNNYGSTALAGNQFYACGYSDKALSTVKVCSLTVDPVSICDTIISAHPNDGPDGTVNGEGFPNPVEIKGININEAIKTSGCSVKAKLQFTGEDSGTFNEITLAPSDGINSFNTYSVGQCSSCQVTMAVCPDNYNGGLFVLFSNEGMKYKAENGNLYVKVTLTVSDVGNHTIEKSLKVNKLSSNL